MSPLPPGLIVVARVVKPHGVRGELRVHPETDFPDRFAPLAEALLVLGGQATPVRLETVRHAGEGLLLKVAGIDAPEQAERWRGALLAVPREQLRALPPGRHYVFELLGMTVESEDGRGLGAIDEVIRTPANDVFVVHGPHGEVLVPAISSVVLAVDVERRRMVIRPMAGMLEDGDEHAG